MPIPIREWKNYISDESPICIRDLTLCASERIYPHTHDHAEFFFVVSGKMIHYLNGKKTIMGPKTAQFIFPDYVHSIEPAHSTKDVRWINISFPLEILSQDINEMIMRLSFKETEKEINLPILPMPNWEIYMQKIDFLLENDDFTQKEILFRNILMDILVVYFQTMKKPASPIPNWLANAMKEMESEENYMAGLERFIELTGKTQNYLNKQIKKHYSISPTQYINRLKLEKAESMLANSDTPITDIIYDCGFHNVSYFYDLFKAKHGMKPMAYRNKYY